MRAGQSPQPQVLPGLRQSSARPAPARGRADSSARRRMTSPGASTLRAPRAAGTGLRLRSPRAARGSRRTADTAARRIRRAALLRGVRRRHLGAVSTRRAERACRRPSPPPTFPPLAQRRAGRALAPGRECRSRRAVICGRCRGSNLSHMAFCQYCGARLDEAPAAPPATSRRGGKASPAVTATTSAPGLVQAARPRPPTPAAAWRLPPPRGAKRWPTRVGSSLPQDGSPGRDYPLSTTQTDIGRIEGSDSAAQRPLRVAPTRPDHAA